MSLFPLLPVANPPNLGASLKTGETQGLSWLTR
jgi:hypothetical protein